MKAQLTNLKLPTAIWQVLYKIDNLLGQTLPWTTRLEEINNILLEALEADAVWLLTLDPLVQTACGSMRTPLTVAPNAQVQIVDKSPPFESGWPTSDSLLGQAIATQQPYFFKSGVANGSTDADLGDVLFDTFDAVPTAVVPLLANEQVIGVLVVGSHDLELPAFPGDRQTFLHYLGEHVGANLYNAHLIEQSRRHNSVLKTLNLIAHTITSSLNIDEVIQKTMAGINELLEVEAGSLLLVDEGTDELYFKITLRGENRQITSFRLGRHEGIAGWVVNHNRPAISNNPDTDKRFSRKIDQAIGFKTTMVLCVPLLVQSQPIGVLEVLNKRTGPFDEADQELLMSMAASLGIALENAQLYEAAQERARHNEIINQITTAINTAHGLTDIGQFIVEQLSRLIQFDDLSLSLLDDTRNHFQQRVLTSVDADDPPLQLFRLEDTALAHIIATNQARVYADISQPDPDALLPPDRQRLLANGIKAQIILPLTTQKSPYGTLNVGHRQAGAYGLTELRLLEQIEPQLAVAIEKSRIIDVMEQHNTELKQINHLSEMLASTTDISLILETTLNMLPRLLPGDVHGVILMGEAGAYLGIATPRDFAQTDQVTTAIQNTFTELREGDTPTAIISTRHITSGDPFPGDWQTVTESHLPILTRLGVLGIIYFASSQYENLSDEIWRTFSLIASQIAATVENARLFQQVEQERARLAAILASSTDAVLVVNRDGRIVLDNPTAWQVMGVEESQRGKLLTESTRNEILVALFEKSRQGDQPTGEIPLMDGRTFYANLSSVTVGNNGVIGSVATMQDVSHFKELNQLKTDFVNAVSHDLRSPLSGILIATHLLPQMGDLNDNQLELVDTIEHRVNNMSHLIDNLLDVGKIEAGIDMEMETCDLISIVDEVTTSLIPQAIDKSIEISCNLPDELLFAKGNGLRLRQVLHNLVGNAIKYTPNGGAVTVTVSRHGPENRIQVSDTGMGIPAADQPHIFEKFYRVKGEHLTGIKGSGLGLAITKSIVEKHHGSIWLESVFGEGSAFTVALPDYAPSDSETP